MKQWAFMIHPAKEKSTPKFCRSVSFRWIGLSENDANFGARGDRVPPCISGEDKNFSVRSAYNLAPARVRPPRRRVSRAVREYRRACQSGRPHSFARRLRGEQG